MNWTAIIGFSLLLLCVTGLVCTVLYCYALYRYISEFGLNGDDGDDEG